MKPFRVVVEGVTRSSDHGSLLILAHSALHSLNSYELQGLSPPDVTVLAWPSSKAIASYGVTWVERIPPSVKRKDDMMRTVFYSMICAALAVLTCLIVGASAQEKFDRTVLPIQEPERPTYSELDVRNVEAPPRFEVKVPENAPNVVIETPAEFFDGTEVLSDIEKVAK